MMYALHVVDAVILLDISSYNLYIDKIILVHVQYTFIKF